VSQPRKGKGLVSKNLLFIIEQGGFPVYADEYKKAGYDVTVAQSVRKGLAELKRQSPDLICAEMNCDPNFRDRVSNLEPVLATVQSLHPSTQVIVFVEEENLPKVDILRQRFNIFDALTYPLNMEEILSSLERASANAANT
jgi:DNA-binding NtrC family response regulator